MNSRILMVAGLIGVTLSSVTAWTCEHGVCNGRCGRVRAAATAVEGFSEPESGHETFEPLPAPIVELTAPAGTIWSGDQHATQRVLPLDDYGVKISTIMSRELASRYRTVGYQLRIDGTVDEIPLKEIHFSSQATSGEKQKHETMKSEKASFGSSKADLGKASPGKPNEPPEATPHEYPREPKADTPHSSSDGLQSKPAKAPPPEPPKCSLSTKATHQVSSKWTVKADKPREPDVSDQKQNENPQIQDSIIVSPVFYWKTATPGSHRIEGRYLVQDEDRQVWSPWSASLHIEVRLPEPPVIIAIGNAEGVPVSVLDGRQPIKITRTEAMLSIKGMAGVCTAEILDWPSPISLTRCWNAKGDCCADKITIQKGDQCSSVLCKLSLTSLPPGTYELIVRNSDPANRWTSKPSKSIQIEYAPNPDDLVLFSINKGSVAQTLSEILNNVAVNPGWFLLEKPACWLSSKPCKCSEKKGMPLTSHAVSVCAEDDSNGGFRGTIQPKALTNLECDSSPSDKSRAGGSKQFSKWFESPAHFPRHEFGARGAPHAREGATIYEGMRFNWDPDGSYEVCFLTEIPAIKTELRVQLLIQTAENGPWKTITLPRFNLIPEQNGNDYKAGIFKVVHKGYSPAIEHSGGSVCRIRRVGTARFGFGDSDTN